MPTKRKIENLLFEMKQELASLRSFKGSLNEAAKKTAEIVASTVFDKQKMMDVCSEWFKDAGEAVYFTAFAGMMAFEPLCNRIAANSKNEEAETVAMMAAMKAVTMYDPLRAAAFTDTDMGEISSPCLYAYVEKTVNRAVAEFIRTDTVIPVPRARELRDASEERKLAANAAQQIISTNMQIDAAEYGDNEDLTYEGILCADDADRPDVHVDFEGDSLEILRAVADIYGIKHAIACGVRMKINDNGTSRVDSNGDNFMTKYKQYLAMYNALEEKRSLTGHTFRHVDCREAVLRSIVSNRDETMSWLKTLDPNATMWYMFAAQAFVEPVYESTLASGKSAVFRYVVDVFGPLHEMRSNQKNSKLRLMLVSKLKSLGYDTISDMLLSAV